MEREALKNEHWEKRKKKRERKKEGEREHKKKGRDGGRVGGRKMGVKKTVLESNKCHGKSKRIKVVGGMWL